MSFLIQAAAIIISVLIAGQVSRRLGQPSVLGQLLVGVLLGPAIFGLLEPTPMIHEMAEIGVILLMFLAGLETNIVEIRKALLTATLVAFTGVALPFVGGWAMATAWGFHGVTAVFTGVLLVATSVSISVQVLRELGQLRSRAGITILAAAVIDDLLGIIVLSVVLGAVGGEAVSGGHGPEPIGVLLLKMIAFFLLAGAIGWKLLPPLLRWVSRFEASTAVLAFAVATALTFAYSAEAAGLAGIIGAYVAGLMLSGTDFRGRLLHEIEHTAFAFFVPFFFVSVGLSARLPHLTPAFLLFIALLTGTAVVTKLIGGSIGARLGGMKWREAIGVGAGMIARGEVGLIVASIGLQRGIISTEIYTAMVVVTLLTTLVTPPLLKLFFAKQSSYTKGEP